MLDVSLLTETAAVPMNEATKMVTEAMGIRRIQMQWKRVTQHGPCSSTIDEEFPLPSPPPPMSNNSGEWDVDGANSTLENHVGRRSLHALLLTRDAVYHPTWLIKD